MSKFTDIELEYLQTQRLGRLATVNKNGEPQIAPVTFRYHAELDTIDIGGLNMGETQKFRNVARNGLASFMIDDVAPHFNRVVSRFVGMRTPFPMVGRAFHQTLARH